MEIMKRHQCLLAVLLLFVAGAAAQAQSTQLTLDPAKTTVKWTLADVLHTVEGTFALKSGAITFDALTGEASGQIIVDAASGNSGNGTRDSKMKKEVLESAKYPEIVFTPKHVSGFVAGKESETVQVAGEFTIHGGTHPLTLTLPITAKGSQIEAQTKFDVPYQQWGMKNPSTLFLKVSNTVQISISAVGDIQAASATRSAN